MNLQITSQNDISIVSVEDSIDSTASVVFDQAVNQLISGGSIKILLDFEKLEFTSSAGLRVILRMAQALRERKGTFALCNLNESVAMIFDLSGFNTILKIYETREEALAKMG